MDKTPSVIHLYTFEAELLKLNYRGENYIFKQNKKT